MPQLEVEVDREKVKREGIVAHRPVPDHAGVSRVGVRERLQQVRPDLPGEGAGGRAVPRHAPRTSRSSRCATRRVRWCRSARWCTVKQSHGPDQGTRYNGYPAADINGGPAPGYSSGQAQDAIEGASCDEVLPNGIGYEWTDLTYQQKLAGNTAVFIFPLCVLLVFLVLAAQYESWSLPLAVILIVPMSLLCAIGGVWLTKGDNNIFTQIGFLVLDRAGLQERDPDRRVRPRAAPAGQVRGRRGAGGLPHPAAADPDDLVRLHHGCASAGVLQRRRRRDAACHGRGGVLRNARA